MGLMSTDLAKPYAALRPSNLSWVLLPHNSVRGQQIHLAGRTRTLTGTLLQIMVLGLIALRPVIQVDIQGRLSTGHPAAIAYTSQQRLHTPTTSLSCQHPKPIAKFARVAQLASISSWLELFSFPAGWRCQKPQLSQHLRLSMPTQCQNSNHRLATRPRT